MHVFLKGKTRVEATSNRPVPAQAARAERSHKRRAVKVTKNVDNAFAFLDLFLEVVTFVSIGLKGAGGWAWGVARKCDLHPDGCPPPETAPQERQTAATRLAGVPLMTLETVDAMQFFWICVLLSVLTPPYLLRAVRQARAQTVGLGPGGAKLRLLSRHWFYFQGIKVAMAGMGPIMTTLFSALVCDTCEPEPKFLSRMAVRCASGEHALYVLAALAGILAYYPVLTYIQPQLQFKSKALDLKFEPTYLTVVAQTKLALSVVVNFWAADRSRRCGTSPAAALNNGFELLAITASLASGLAVHTARTMPCIVPEFNVFRAGALGVSASFLWGSLATFWLQRTTTRLKLGKHTARPIGAAIFLALSALCQYHVKRTVQKIKQARIDEVDDAPDSPRMPTARRKESGGYFGK